MATPCPGRRRRVGGKRPVDSPPWKRSQPGVGGGCLNWSFRLQKAGFPNVALSAFFVTCLVKWQVCQFGGQSAFCFLSTESERGLRSRNWFWAQRCSRSLNTCENGGRLLAKVTKRSGKCHVMEAGIEQGTLTTQRSLHFTERTRSLTQRAFMIVFLQENMAARAF